MIRESLIMIVFNVIYSSKIYSDLFFKEDKLLCNYYNDRDVGITRENYPYCVFDRDIVIL